MYGCKVNDITIHTVDVGLMTLRSFKRYINWYTFIKIYDLLRK